jgi:hypothetical protein
MKKKILIFAFPGTGKTFTTQIFKNTCDFESLYYIFEYNKDVLHWHIDKHKGRDDIRVKSPDFPQNYIEALKEELEKKRIVITPFMVNNLAALEEADFDSETRIIVVTHDENDYETLAKRFSERGNAKDFIDLCREWLPKINERAKEIPDIEVVTLSGNKFLMDALNDLDVPLIPGVGVDNYYKKNN